ncbi:MAG TPA: hypothetical protein VGP50_14755 [Stellaceae bacterium]|jgi:hypothetical protein|nr:hypothetical protein [Stellaceae bacterium]
MVEISITNLVLAIIAMDRDIKAREKALRDGLISEANEDEETQYVLDLWKARSELIGAHDRARERDPKLSPIKLD